MTKHERLDAVRARYRETAVRRGVNPRDVDLLLGDLLDRPLPFLIAHGDTPVDPEPLRLLLERRFAGEPLQYIRYRAEFFSRQFYVDDRVLIPRPETEVLVEAAIDSAPRGGRVIDIGTGSGCIAISLALERPDLRVVAIDRSIDALAVAARNRQALGARVFLAASDLLAAIEGDYDLIVSNPPYIAAAEVERLMPEVRDHEPRMALTPGPSGTEIIERMLAQIAERAAGARVMIEVGFGQEAAIRAVAAVHGYEVETFIPDLAGIARVVVLSAHGRK
jgi:release factor glutamine methyltransferase